MTNLDCFKATVNHEQHPKFLHHARFCPSLEQKIRSELKVPADQKLADFFAMRSGVAINMQPPKNLAKPDFSMYYDDINKRPDAFINGLGVLETPGSVAHFTSYTSPLRAAQTLDELEKYPYPNVDGFSDSGLAGAVEKAHSEGNFAEMFTGHMYEDSWQIRGYEPFLMDMIYRLDWCEYILDRIKDRNIKVAVAAAKAGVDLLRSGDDVANQKSLMFSSDLWRNIMKPRWAEVYAAARNINPNIQIWYHSDGNIIEIIPDFIEIGVTILNPVQPECLDIEQLKLDYGDRIVFDGTIGTQSTMPFGTPDEVRRVVRSRAKHLGQDGALILSPTHLLEPEVPVKNVVAFFDEVQKL